MKERPKIDFLKMSHPQFDSWEIFAKQCYAHMDHLEQEVKELKGWKKEQIELFEPFYAIMQNHPNVKLGESMVSKAIEFIQENEELKAKTFKAATALYDLKTENKELKGFVRHDDDCSFIDDSSEDYYDKCTCGLDKLLES